MQARQRAEGSHQTLGYVPVGHHFTGQHCVQQLGEFLAVHLMQLRGHRQTHHPPPLPGNRTSATGHSTKARSAWFDPVLGVVRSAAALSSANAPAAPTATDTARHRFDGYAWMILPVVKAWEYLTLGLGL